MVIEAVDSMLRARRAFFCLKIKVFGEIALNALNVSKEWFVGRALASALLTNIVSTSTAFLTSFY